MMILHRDIMADVALSNEHKPFPCAGEAVIPISGLDSEFYEVLFAKSLRYDNLSLIDACDIITEVADLKLYIKIICPDITATRIRIPVRIFYQQIGG